MLKDLIKEILKEELSGKNNGTDSCQVDDQMTGKLVMVRTYSAGVHFGNLKKRSGKELVLTNAHRVHYWTNACSLSQLAIEGSKNKNPENRISMAVPEILLTEAIEVIPMPQETFTALTSHLWRK
jgi:hypothetical protein